MENGATSPAIANDTAKQADEVNVLGRFVGTWDMDLTVKPTSGDVIKAKKTEVRTWSLGGAFVRFQDAQPDGTDPTPTTACPSLSQGFSEPAGL